MATVLTAPGLRRAVINPERTVYVNAPLLALCVQCVVKLYFLFENGNTLDEATVRYAQSLNVPVVTSVNTFHYSGTRSSWPSG